MKENIIFIIVNIYGNASTLGCPCYTRLSSSVRYNGLPKLQLRWLLHFLIKFPSQAQVAIPLHVKRNVRDDVEHFVQ